MVISMLEIRRPLGRLIFNMGIAGELPYLVRPSFLLRRPPGSNGIRHMQFNKRHVNRKTLEIARKLFILNM